MNNIGMNNMYMSTMLAEDIGMPELRNPKCSGMRQENSVIGKIRAFINSLL